MRTKVWLDPEIHLPSGVVGVYEDRGGNSFLTNARPELVSTVKVRRTGEVTIRREEEAFVTEGDPLGAWVLKECGFDNGRSPKRKRAEGKFVFQKDGTFFLGNTGIPHVDLPGSISVYDRLAILSAGFISLTLDGVDLHGESIGLRRGPYLGTPFDRQVISAYFGIPFELTDEEFL